MRVWLVQRAESTPHDDDGARRMMRMGILANFLQARGHTVIWWTSAFDHVKNKHRFKQSKRLMVNDNYYVHYLKCFGYKNNKSISRIIDNRVVAKQFTKDALKDNIQPDIMLVAMPSIELAQHAVCYANKHNIPVFLDIRDLWPDVFRDLLPRFMGWFVRLATLPMKRTLKQVCQKATAITGITEEFVNWGVAHSGRCKSDLDVHFPMAYVGQKFNDSILNDARSFWRKLGCFTDHKCIYVLFLGTFTKSFDFETVFAAAKKLDDTNAQVKFIFCGIGKKETYIRSLCSELSNCMFAGWVNAAQIHIALQQSDIGLAPYIGTANFINNIPNKPAEYMSEGLTVATSLIKGTLFELLKKEKCGFSYGEDANILALSLNKLSENREKLVIMQEHTKDVFVKQFDGNRVYAEMISYLENNIRK